MNIKEWFAFTHAEQNEIGLYTTAELIKINYLIRSMLHLLVPRQSTLLQGMIFRNMYYNFQVNDMTRNKLVPV